MKKAILGPLASAFVIPGLGQIIVGRVRKGLFILGANLLAFSGGVTLLVRFILRTMKTGQPKDPSSLFKDFPGQDAPLFWMLVIAFTGLWLYSVVDAFLAGRKMDRTGEETP